jgi:hypothetical protein
MRYLKVTARWESSALLEVDDDADALIGRAVAGDLDAVVEAGDIDTSNAELVDWTAREVARP